MWTPITGPQPRLPHEIYEDAYRRATGAGEHDRGARVRAAQAVYDAGQASVRVAPVRTAIARALRGLASKLGPLLVLLLCACAFAEPQALETDQGDESSGTDESGESGSSDGQPPALTTAADAGASSGGGPEPGETGSSSSIGTDGDAESGSEATGGSSDGGTDGGGDDPYGDCYAGDPVPENQLCAGSCVVGDDREALLSACAPPCGPEPELECEGAGVCLHDLVLPQVGATVCVLDCESVACPDGMTCTPMTYASTVLQLCMWP